MAPPENSPNIPPMPEEFTADSMRAAEARRKDMKNKRKSIAATLFGKKDDDAMPMGMA